MVSLKRELNLFNVTIAGVGIILGAGIYALIGVAAGETGNTIWLSFLIASIVAGFTGLSYAELSSYFKGDGGEYDYIKESMGFKIAWVTALIIIITGVVSAATVALGFAGYLSSLVSINFLLAASLIVVLMTLLNFYGIAESNKFNTVATLIEFFGLIIIIALGISKFGVSNVDLLDMPNGLMGVFSAGALVFFSFMGFETIIKLREETKNPQKTIPLAIVFSIIITAIVYILVSIAAVTLIPASQLAVSDSPLASVAAASFGNSAFVVIAIIALFSTSNTILLTMLTTSRMTYDLGKSGALPKFLGKVHKKRRTPYVSVFIIGIVTLLLAFIGNIELVANITTALLFITFALVNLAVIILRYKNPKQKSFKIPLNVGKFPILPALGVLTSLVMLWFSLGNIF